MSVEIKISSDAVPNGFCPITDKDWQFLSRLLHASLQGDPTINYGSTTPPPDKRDLPWFRTTGGYPDRWYSFQQGLWVSLHPSPSGIITMYRGTLASIDTLDEGEAGVPTTISGPFWKKVDEADGRMPIQPGALPSGAAIALGDVGGEDKHTLVTAELATHKHLLANIDASAHDDNVASLGPTNTLTKTFSTGQSGLAYALQGTSTAPTLGMSEQVGSDTPHNNMPPYIGLWFIERTVRRYYRQSA